MGAWSGTEGGSVDPKGKVVHWSAPRKNTREGSEEVKGAGDEKQGSKMEVDEAAPGQLGQKSQEKKVISLKRPKWKWMVRCPNKRVLKSKVRKAK